MLDLTAFAYPQGLERKLSETLQVLEESLIIAPGSSPGSVTIDGQSSVSEDWLSPQELLSIKQQLITLQQALLSQQLLSQDDNLMTNNINEMVCYQNILFRLEFN